MRNTRRLSLARVTSNQRPEDCFAGGGSIGELMQSMDWSATPLGPAATWPQSLRTSVSICLASRFPIVLYWGPQFITLYNDAYSQILAGKHPWALGRPCAEVWSEIWDVIGPMLDGVVTSGQATWSDDQLLMLHRHGYSEECYFSFSFSPVRDETGGVGGIFTAVTENTIRVIGERRLRTLRELGTRALEARTPEEACRLAAATLSRNPADLPFVLIYLLEGESRARLAGTAVLPQGLPTSPSVIDLAIDDDSFWPVARVARTGVAELVTEVRTRFGDLPGGPWPESPHSVFVAPAGAAPGKHSAAVLIAGVSPRKELDDDYKGFLDLIAGHVATSIDKAVAYEEERKRAEAFAELDRAKTAFFSNVSHEFRTPLTLMLGPLEDTLRRDAGRELDSETREQLQVAHRNGLRLLKLVNTLLDFSRIEAGRTQASFEPVDLALYTTELASVFRSAIENAGLRLAVDCPTLPESIYVDRDMWEKVVLNLISNAFKFTFEGEIEVKLEWRGSYVELTVRDTGTGIPEQEVANVFRRFHRIRGARARTHEGSGIGLSLVQELVWLHGGTVEVASVFGSGTTFSVWIPTGKAHLPADCIGSGTNVALTPSSAMAYLEEETAWLAGQPTVVSNDETPNKAAEASRIGVVLLADDNSDMREYIRRLLSREYSVEAVADGGAALQAARERTPDLILTDIMMPGLDGFGLLRELRADSRLRDVPVIMLSARAGEEACVDGLDAGADDYLIKPFAARELLARVRTHMDLRRLRLESQAALLLRERELTDFLENAPLGLHWVGFDGSIIWANQAELEMLGYSREEYIGRQIAEFHIDQTVIEDMLERLNLGEEIRNCEARLRCKDGSIRHVLISSNVYRKDGRFIHTRCFTRDITARTRAEQALREADRRKDEFLAMLAHELRNPLAPIRNAVHVLRLLDLPDAQLQWARDLIDRQVNHLTRLVDDLLDVSRITHGKITLQRETVDLAAIVDRAVETCRPLIDSRKHELKVLLPPEPLPVDGDPTRLAQVLANLLSNAAKYTDERGRLSITATRERNEAVVRVRDTGVGIPAELLPYVFDLFTQGHRSLDRSQGGLGIGLTLVRTLVEMHGGRVDVSSAGVGCGSEFVVYLPAFAERAQVVELVSPPATERAESTHIRILVVDDNLDSAESLRLMLQLEGYEVQVAMSGESAHEIADTFEPHLVFLDIGLPKVDGYEVARQLRQQPSTRGAVLVAFTGYGQEYHRQRAKEAGFDHHVVKPVPPSELLQLVRLASGGGNAGARAADTLS